MRGTEYIYLDNAATTPLDPEAFQAMEPYLRKEYGNPSSVHTRGLAAARAVSAARVKLASLLNAAPAEVVFTSGGTEADNWALIGSVMATGKRHLIISAIEHHAVSETASYLRTRLGCDVDVLPVDSVGRVDPQLLAAALRPDTAVVSLILGSNEVGTVQDVASLSAVARERGALFHTDAVQAVGKIPIDVQAMGIDLLSLSAHKFNGPKGVGALVVRGGVSIDHYQHGGGQEGGRRAGTVNVPGVVGLGAAAGLATDRLAGRFPAEFEMIDRTWNELKERIPGIRRNGDPRNRLPNILSICLDDVDGEAVQMRLDAAGIGVSSGAACAAGSQEPSPVLLALGVPRRSAIGSLRISLGPQNSDSDLDQLIETLPVIVSDLRKLR